MSSAGRAGEALANAFVHRDHAIGGGSVSVALYDDRLEIISIGDLHFGITPEAVVAEVAKRLPAASAQRDEAALEAH